MDQLDDRASDLLNSALGCTFLVAVSETGNPIESITDPEEVLRLAAECADYVDPFGAEHSENVALVLEYAQSRRELARALLEHPNSDWWFSPLDRSCQVWISRDGKTFLDMAWQPASEGSKAWEQKVQKPLRRISSSTLKGSASSEMIAYDLQVGDHFAGFPLTVYQLVIPETYRVFEIHCPAEWHNLCFSYPAPGKDQSSRHDGRITPDWNAVSMDWDGVHLSFGGLLACEQARYERDGTWSMHQFWQAELSFWFNTDGITAIELPEYARNAKGSEVGIPVFEEQLEPRSFWPRGLKPAPVVLPPRPAGFRVARR